MSMLANSDKSQPSEKNVCPTASRLLQHILSNQDRDFGDECSALHDAIEPPHTLKVFVAGPSAKRPRSAGFMQDRDTGDETQHAMNG
jgi:hypothetical protein